MMILMMILMTHLADNLKTGARLVILVCQGLPEPVSYSQHWNWNQGLGKRWVCQIEWITLKLWGEPWPSIMVSLVKMKGVGHLAQWDIWPAWGEAPSWHDTRISPRLELRLAKKVILDWVDMDFGLSWLVYDVHFDDGLSWHGFWIELTWIADEAHMDHELRQKMVWGRSLLDPNLFDPKLTKLQSLLILMMETCMTRTQVSMSM